MEVKYNEWLEANKEAAEEADKQRKKRKSSDVDTSQVQANESTIVEEPEQFDV